MRCPSCMAENAGTRRFCAQCGTPLPSPCPACGFENEPTAKSCGGCGKPIGETATQAPPIVPAPLAPIAPSDGSSQSLRPSHPRGRGSRAIPSRWAWDPSSARPNAQPPGAQRPSTGTTASPASAAAPSPRWYDERRFPQPVSRGAHRAQRRIALYHSNFVCTPGGSCDRRRPASSASP
jgi:Double zinc ribbon